MDTAKPDRPGSKRMSAAPRERAVLLMAAGAGRRLGRDKRWVHVGGEPLVVRAVGLASSTSLPIFAAVRRGDVAVQLPMVALLHEPAQPRSALVNVRTWLHELGVELLVLAADLPLLTAAFLRQLLAVADATPDAEFVAATSAGKIEPLCALYRPTAAVTLTQACSRGESSLARLLGTLDVRQCVRVPAPAEELLLNVNDPVDLQRARLRVRG